MKKAILFAAAALALLGCAESNNNNTNSMNCGHGHQEGSQCVCDAGYVVNFETFACTTSIQTVDPVCGHGQYYENRCYCFPGYAPTTDAQKCTETTPQKDCGHGQVQNGICACDTGYSLDSNGACTTPDPMPCFYGHRENGVCVCDKGYALDSNGTCTTQDPNACPHGHMENGACVCDKGYQLDSSGTCTEPATICQIAFEYIHADTCAATGGTNQKVYLIGEMNSWTPEDPGMEMKADNNCKRSIIIDIKEGTKLKYKFYIAGMGDDGYRADPLASADEDGNNQTSGECGMTYQYTEKAPTQVKPPVDPTPDTPTPDTPTPDPAEECETTFKYFNAYTNIGSGGVSDFKVHLVGDFNEWEKNDSNYTMTSDGKGCHSITVKLKKGSNYGYKYHIEGWENQETGQDDGWMSDPYNTNYDNYGNSSALISACNMHFGDCEVLPETPGDVTPPDPPTPPAPDANADLKSVSVTGKTITITLKDGVHATAVTGGSGKASINGSIITDTVSENNKYVYIVTTDNGEVYVPVWVESRAFDWHDALLYFAFTDRFVNGDPNNDKKSHTWDHCAASDWYGGDFKGMQQKVEAGYFDDLGVDTLWISSVTKNTEKTSEGTNGDNHNYSAYHSYWPVSAFMTDYNKSDFGSLPAIEDHFGTLDDLRNLVDACHKRGIRVLVDFAANHVFKDSPMLSKHPEWFNDTNNPQLCDNNNNWDNYSEKCWFSQDLPDINYENADARKTMVDHAIWLIKQTNVDGFRVDAVKHMNIQFIKDLRAATDKLFANTGIMFYMVGETFTGDVGLLNKYIGADLLHAQFDFPLYYKLGNVLRGHGLYDLAANYNAQFNSDLMGIFMGNHDVARAISVANGDNENKWGSNPTPNYWDPYDRLMAAWTILFTRPGVPLIYYGDEYGMPGSNDPDNRRMMQFGSELNEQQKGTLAYVQALGKIRRAHLALSRGRIETLDLKNTAWCYKREYGGETIIVGIGLRTNSDGGPGSCNLKGSYKLKNLFDGTESTLSSLDLSTNKFQLYLVN
ncbi:MAG: hypothetical protein IKY83_02140 [Proteobacteria bacterium]|nr:hypothetical protein [Pseudomonadota bacterium]